MKRLLLLLLCSTIMAKSANQLVKGYHHQGPTNDQIVLYFSSKPDCTLIPQKESVDGQVLPVRKDGIAQLDFFIPSLHISKKVSHFVQAVNDLDNGMYRCFIREDNNKKGIMLSILFKPENVGFQQEQFEAITGHQALAFTFFNRSALKNINVASRPLLRTAQVKKKPVLF